MSARRAVLSVAVVTAAGFGYARLAEQHYRAPSVGLPAPELRLPGLEGSRHDLADERGRLVVLNFWASWCAPCVEEMPSLDRLARALADEGVSVVAVSTDEDDESPRRFVAAHHLSLRVLRDPGGRQAASAWGVVGYPETFLIGRDGRLVDHVVGPAEWDSPEWLSRLRGLLRASTAPTR